MTKSPQRPKFKKQFLSLLTRFRSFSRKLFFFGVFGGLSLALFILGCNLLVESKASPFIYEDVNAIQSHPVGLVLGTSSRLSDGRPNLFFKYRMEAAARAFQSGKVQHLLVSGDNRFTNYNEPQTMKNALVKKGIPAQAITLDYAGLRTLDSVIRAKQIFGQHQLTIVSQRSHVERAVFIARYHQIEAFGLCAQNVPLSVSAKTTVREWFARCKAVMDVYVLNKEPRHLGEPEPIRLNAPTAASP